MTDEDEDRLTLGTSEVAALLQLTTPQIDEDRQSKTETDEDRLILGTGEVAAPLQLTAPRSNEDGT